jgi:predicted regulator of Ras-like GTPase activity (Roadblock/LC7/MglB family)
LSHPHRQDLNWLVTEFTTRVEDVAHAIVVSADGVPLALSAGIPSQAVEQLAAITSGLTSLIVGAARVFEAGLPTQALVEMDRGLMFVKSISDGSSLAVLTAPECDTRQISYEMTLLVEAVGEVLTPDVRAEIPSRAGRPGLSLRRVAASSGRVWRGEPAAYVRDKNARDDCHGERPPPASALRPVSWRRSFGRGKVTAQDSPLM